MNEERKADRLRTSRDAALRAWLQYIGLLLAWGVGLLAVLWGGIMVGDTLIFQPGLVYDLLHFLMRNVAVLYATLLLAGWLFISYQCIARPVRDLEVLIGSTGALAHPDETPIRLPAGLHGAEVQLNLVREQALRRQQEARDAEQRKNDLVVYLAHDLKTPLTSVIGYLTLLQEEPDLPAAQRARYTGVALEKALRLEDLVNEFFDITRFSLSHLELELQEVDLKRMLEQLCSEFGPALAEKGLACDLALSEGLRAVCDPDKMARVFDNLLNNACHYARPGSRVRVEGARQGDALVLTFANAGRTIPPEKLERMFERFFRLDSARGSRGGNAGLGLAIAREIVEAHGGSITAASADGQVVFTVTLPLS